MQFMHYRSKNNNWWWNGSYHSLSSYSKPI